MSSYKEPQYGKPRLWHYIAFGGDANCSDHEGVSREVSDVAMRAPTVVHLCDRLHRARGQRLQLSWVERYAAQWRQPLPLKSLSHSSVTSTVSLYSLSLHSTATSI